MSSMNPLMNDKREIKILEVRRAMERTLSSRVQGIKLHLRPECFVCI